MNRTELLTQALQAVNFQKADARNHLTQARTSRVEHAIQYWTVLLEEHEATYKGLLDWLHALDQSGGDQ